LQGVSSDQVLHIPIIGLPSSAASGNALVHNGDVIEVDVEARKIHLDVSAEELAARRSQWKKPEPATKGGYQQLYVDHVMQADKGADFDFLVGCRGAAVPRESH
jgi:L-arabonate dehydrase